MHSGSCEVPGGLDPHPFLGGSGKGRKRLRLGWQEGRGERAGAGDRQEQLALLSQHSDSDSDPEYSALPPSIPSAVPVTGESYCDCAGQSEASFCSSLHSAHRGKDCQCGEEDECEMGSGPCWDCTVGGPRGGQGRAPWSSQSCPSLGLSYRFRLGLG